MNGVGAGRLCVGVAAILIARSSRPIPQKKQPPSHVPGGGLLTLGDPPLYCSGVTASVRRVQLAPEVGMLIRTT